MSAATCRVESGVCCVWEVGVFSLRPITMWQVLSHSSEEGLGRLIKCPVVLCGMSELAHYFLPGWKIDSVMKSVQCLTVCVQHVGRLAVDNRLFS